MIGGIKMEIKCFACRDKGGLIMREIKVNKKNKESYMYDYFLQCSTCAAGNSNYYNGKNNTKHKSKYYTPSISSYIDINQLITYNKINQWKSWLKYKTVEDNYEIERIFIEMR